MHKEIFTTNTRYRHYYAIEDRRTLRLLNDYRYNPNRKLLNRKQQMFSKAKH